MAQPIFERIRAIDVDSHITEPPDVWTARVASKWGDAVPHVKRVDGRDFWYIRDQMVGAPGFTAAAGFDGSLPEARLGFDDIPRSAFDAKARLAHLDAEGIYAQVLYPNVGGFGSGVFLRLGEPALMLECVRAYNDWLLDWCGAAPERLIPILATPFWDVPASVAEIERCAAAGHKGVLFGSQPHAFGQPPLTDRHWDRVFAAAQAVDLPISFHIGSGDVSGLLGGGGLGLRTGLARASAQLFLENSNCLADLVFGGICHRFPRLRFVSVESGAAWVLFALEAFDWQWRNNGVASEHPEYDLLPSEYFRRQIYACFWFEEEGLKKAIEIYPDNLLFETDFPHPTCLYPESQAHLAQVLARLEPSARQRVVQDNAVELYKIPLPA